jgi:hypothetical protein
MLKNLYFSDLSKIKEFAISDLLRVVKEPEAIDFHQRFL